jgi:2-dehydro-3-deoxyphosphogalactonate aldolase
MMATLASLLAKAPLVAILRGIRPAEIPGIAAALIETGFRILEVPLNSPEPLESIARLARGHGGEALVGAGTVRRVSEVEAVHAAGGRLIVMPHADGAVVRRAKELGMLAIPGFLTPSEAFAMIDAGADGLKLFPAEAASPAVLRSLRAVLPKEIPILPVGGIDAGSIPAWLQAGADGFGIGSALYKPGVDAAEIALRGRKLMQALPGNAGAAGGWPLASVKRRRPPPSPPRPRSTSRTS